MNSTDCQWCASVTLAIDGALLLPLGLMSAHADYPGRALLLMPFVLFLGALVCAFLRGVAAVELGGRRLWAALGVGIFFVGVLGFKVLVWTQGRTVLPSRNGVMPPRPAAPVVRTTPPS
jgi:hypothetical protein